MDTPSTSAAALKLEIARLTGAINRRKTEDVHSAPAQPTTRSRNNVYVNPNYKPPSKPASRTWTASKPPQAAATTESIASSASEKREVVIGGVAFESSGRSLVRKDLQKASGMAPAKPPAMKPTSRTANFSRTNTGAMINTSRMYKPKASRRGRPTNRNMTLTNTRRPYPSRRLATKRKFSDKPCPRFTTTGACNRGLTCMYQHDPSKIAICWSFLQGNCPNTAETCNLSHDPTPERTPLCVHFANAGRCTRQNCPFPHVRVGARHGVCRDFAVLGYCEKGLDCDKQHVRECPDFAEKGECTTKGCKLPHVIRANRTRKAPASTSAGGTDTAARATWSGISAKSLNAAPASDVASPAAGTDDVSSLPVTAEDAQIGDEYVSLTFNESESDSDEESEEEEEEEADGEEGSDPIDDDRDADDGHEE